MKRTMTAAFIAVAVVFGAASTLGIRSASAQGADARKKAAEYFAAGEREYTLGRFKTAIEKYKLGFEELPDQWFLFNIAQSYRQLDDCKQAVFFYKRYLAFAKRPVSERKRNLKIEKQVEAEFIPALQEKCKRDKVIRDTPPDFVEGGGATTGGKTTGNKTTGGATTGGATTGGKTGAGAGKDVASNGDDDDDDDDDDGDEYGDDDDDDDVGGISAGVGEKPSLVVGNIAVGPSFLGVGDGLEVPTQVSFTLGAGYPLALGPVDLVAGGLVTYTPVPWDFNGLDGTASLTTVLANAVAGYQVIPKLSVRGEVGVGVLLFGGLDRGNPFTLNGAEASGALSALNVRISIGAEYAVMDNIIVTVAPVVFAYSPAPADMRMDLNSVTRFELMFGAGYRM